MPLSMTRSQEILEGAGVPVKEQAIEIKMPYFRKAFDVITDLLKKPPAAHRAVRSPEQALVTEVTGIHAPPAVEDIEPLRLTVTLKVDILGKVGVIRQREGVQVLYHGRVAAVNDRAVLF
jgi:hypothetical protein